MQREQALCIGSSEGGLFEYGSVEEILANLRALGSGFGAGFSIVGSVSALVARAGWYVARSVKRPLSDQVVLESGAQAP